MARIIAIDYGLKRCGLAWTDPLQIIATGVGTVDAGALEDKLKSMIAAEKVESIILGYPTREDGSDTHTTQPVLELKARLEKLFPGLPVMLWDERYTSKMAKQSMIAGGLGRKKRRDKAMVDEISATLILQEYLESKS